MHRDETLPVLRWPLAALLAIVAALPFLFTTVPPLTDVPGHVGRFAVQTAPAGSGLFRYFGFHWGLTLNLASDVLVQLLHPLVGVEPVVWLLCAATPVLTAAGILAVARVCNPRGAYALPWALLFVFNFPFLWGFLNFALTMALGLIAFAGWIALDARRGLRAALFLAVIPILLVGHGVAGIATIGMLGGHAAWSAGLARRAGWRAGGVRNLLALWPLGIAGFVTIAVWKTIGVSDGGHFVWLPYRKFDAILMMLRDQDVVLDVGSVVACGVVWLLGRRWGAPLRGGAAGPVIVMALMVLATPSLIGGSDQIDTRLAPLIPMLAFALQDWSVVTPRRRRAVALAGAVLLASRLAITTASFAAYDARYASELAALDHIAPGSRILNLSWDDCGVAGWRSARTEHLANLATARRGAFVNAHWSIGGLQLLEIRYHPSPAYDRDPSHLIWPAHCIDPTRAFADRDSHRLLESMPVLPLDRVDYLWLIGEKLPPGYQDRRLRRIWSNATSELYATD